MITEVIWNDVPKLIKSEMLRLQFEQTGKRDVSVFEKKLSACRSEGGIDWPTKFFEQWSEALKDGKFNRLLKHIPVGKPRKKSSEDPESKNHPEAIAEAPAAKRKYTRRVPTEKAEPKEGIIGNVPEMEIQTPETKMSIQEDASRSKVALSETIHHSDLIRDFIHEIIEGSDNLKELVKAFGIESTCRYYEMKLFIKSLERV